ncbi:Major outer membrane lipoprotein Oprl [Dillenia turbinata]|uniref:Major outer membrane lipoprotein Oprl n=1 Tax=Dillenia turbinata TaxID=194707 RepID=A0AAN8VR01_9MAGN
MEETTSMTPREICIMIIGNIPGYREHVSTSKQIEYDVRRYKQRADEAKKKACEAEKKANEAEKKACDAEKKADELAKKDDKAEKRSSQINDEIIMLREKQVPLEDHLEYMMDMFIQLTTQRANVSWSCHVSLQQGHGDCCIAIALICCTSYNESVTPIVDILIIGAGNQAEKDGNVKLVLNLKNAEVEEGYIMDAISSHRRIFPKHGVAATLGSSGSGSFTIIHIIDLTRVVVSGFSRSGSFLCVVIESESSKFSSFTSILTIGSFGSGLWSIYCHPHYGSSGFALFIVIIDTRLTYGVVMIIWIWFTYLYCNCIESFGSGSFAVILTTGLTCGAIVSGSSGFGSFTSVATASGSSGSGPLTCTAFAFFRFLS